MLLLVRIEKQKRTRLQVYILLAELFNLVRSSPATFYASQDRNVFLIMMLGNYC